LPAQRGSGGGSEGAGEAPFDGPAPALPAQRGAGGGSEEAAEAPFDNVMAHQFIFTMKDLRKIVPPKREILKGIWLSFYPGAKIGVLGPNGAGKSTLLRIMAGVDRDFLGEAFPAEGVRIGYLPQEPQLDSNRDVRGNVEDGVSEPRALLAAFEAVSARLGAPMSDAEMEKALAEQARLQDQIEAVNGWDLDRTIEIAMDALRVPPGDASVEILSGGEQRRVALCRLLLQKPDMLLLDEPTNHLDAESVAWLERYLKEYPGTVVAITHDRYFLDNVAGWILELDQGKGIPWEGNYSSWLEQKRQRLANEEKAESARQRTLARELEWVRQAPRARQAKSKARLASYDVLLAEQQEGRGEAAEISIPPGPRLGDLVVRAEHVSKDYGDRLLIDDLSFNLPRGGIVGVIGANGAGKTTLFRMIVGQETPDAGALRVGESVKLAYVDQSRDALDDSKTAWEEISGGADTIMLGKRQVASRAWVASFNFKGADQQKKVGDLSGGERNRVHLAKVIKSGGNLLLLDEPTNDLDVDTLRALEDALLAFAGCAVVITHDRWFLDRITTHMLAFEGDSRVVWFEGNYADYESDRRKRLGAEADQPHRLRYKKLHRD
jgi:energy-dependent translational throttle protein EttA